ncbi:hypothetical protein AX16_007864 [Volvariella volvacea WC 439]|nr:hypothetical protein AX16_007864 [Volvariella volvacea WC 439]
MPTIPNVILFGASGCRKSSIVNMLADPTAFAPTSPDTTRCTSEITYYRVSIFGQPFNIYDTPGLEEGGKDSAETIFKLCDRLKNMTDGVNLLVFSINEPGGMETWWFNNKKHFAQLGMVPQRHAYITTTRGKETQPGLFAYGKEYEESQDNVRCLIISRALVTGWRIRKKIIPSKGSHLQKVLVAGGMTKEEALSLSDAVPVRKGMGLRAIVFWVVVVVVIFFYITD